VECKECGEDVDTLVTVKVGKKARKLCEDCAGLLREEDELLAGAESAMKSMMEYKGRQGGS